MKLHISHSPSPAPSGKRGTKKQRRWVEIKNLRKAEAKSNEIRLTQLQQQYLHIFVYMHTHTRAWAHTHICNKRWFTLKKVFSTGNKTEMTDSSLKSIWFSQTEAPWWPHSAKPCLFCVIRTIPHPYPLNKYGMPHLLKCPRLGWIGLWETWSSEMCSCPQQAYWS